MGLIRLNAVFSILWMGLVLGSVTGHRVRGDDFRVLGLEVSWTANVQLVPGSSGLISAQLWSDDSRAKTYAVVELGERSFQVSTDLLDDKFEPLGEEGAKREVERLASRYLGRKDGFEVELQRRPLLRLVAVTRDGVVHCWDAETGNLHWATACGPSTSPAYPAALSHSGVVVVHGENLYHLDWNTGDHIQVKPLPSGTVKSVAIIDAPIVTSRAGEQEVTTINSLALVSDLKGFVNGYSLNNHIDPWTYQLVGRSVGTPVSLPDKSSTAIATDLGWLYVFSGSLDPTVQFRFESGNNYGGSKAAGRDAFYIGNMSGSFSKVSTRDRGALEWTYRLSQAITAPPLLDPMRRQIYVATEAGELTAISDDSGTLAWNQIVFGSARVRGPIALCRGSVICRTFSHTLVAYDASSGQLLGQTKPLPLADKMIVNGVSDRVYLINRRGALMCLRPIGKQHPTILLPAKSEKTDEESEAVDKELETPRDGDSPRSTDPFDSQEDDPFGDGDPFGGDPF